MIHIQYCHCVYLTYCQQVYSVARSCVHEFTVYIQEYYGVLIQLDHEQTNRENRVPTVHYLFPDQYMVLVDYMGDYLSMKGVRFMQIYNG